MLWDVCRRVQGVDWHQKLRATCKSLRQADAQLLQGVLVQLHHPRQSDKCPGLATWLRHGGHGQRRRLHCIAQQVPCELWRHVRSHTRVGQEPGYPPSKHSWRGSSSSACPSDNSSRHPTTSTTPLNSNSVITTTAGTTVEAEAVAATMAMAAATGNNQPRTKANKAVARGMCIPPHPTSDGRIGTIAIHMAVMSKTPTQVPRAPDKAPFTTRMPRVPTPWAAHRQGCIRRSHLLHLAVPHLPPANSNNSSNILLSPTTPRRILHVSHLLGSMGSGSPWQCPLLSKALPL